MFKGTKKVPAGQFSRIVAAAGGKENAFTSRCSITFLSATASPTPIFNVIFSMRQDCTCSCARISSNRSSCSPLRLETTGARIISLVSSGSANT